MAGQKSDIESAPEMNADLPQSAMLLADKGDDANALRNSSLFAPGYAEMKLSQTRGRGCNRDNFSVCLPGFQLELRFN
jgi:hypothetical protein